MSDVVFLNPRTCGIYKDGGPRYKTDHRTGRRTDQIDNELKEHVEAYLASKNAPGQALVPLESIFGNRVLVPTYYDDRYNEQVRKLVEKLGTTTITLGDLIDDGTIRVRGGHGSPGNDQRSGHIPYVKVSDIRGLRVNINPTNLVTESVARRYWRGGVSGIETWDLVTPNRASSNIGEFAIILPGEEQVVITKEVFVLRVMNRELIDPFYLLWALSLKSVRDQWRRIALMQTNREDCGNRYREVLLPRALSKGWADRVSQPFRDYFTTMAAARTTFMKNVAEDTVEYVANVRSTIPLTDEEATEAEVEASPARIGVEPPTVKTKRGRKPRAGTGEE
jgi:type I restriction enzyme M protein